MTLGGDPTLGIGGHIGFYRPTGMHPPSGATQAHQAEMEVVPPPGEFRTRPRTAPSRDEFDFRASGSPLYAAHW